MVATQKYKTMLEERLKELDARLHELDEELDAHQSKDWEEMATEREQDEVFEGLGHAGEEEIVRIKAALDRMEQGEYGFCVKCGTEISEARLDVVPATPFCQDCAAKV
ncbi:TraR/DksA family transcriptional regulator [Rhodalgimonas zhirmunskyi]|uniref:TraR/DksA C4-type zinc finger protein n=1 Tax=Rhodalgimonas zhirmunskyi TaxID=2964767 RepID=A0AAJ1UFI6_9RHOB|nr:TraR/DksA C4-type zinc finger protein [Rhodoalgimonas zhirmunskyi]MDQ2095306.1 TraR/DksA C4-type zinc finger protein [Rhodoalgimonas zhirmunskyi]